ncbi:ubiquitin carboxyl-terminal hydrolase 23 isoform X2 [Daucus carota subsp. sativus]|uniref:ubiquitin carboxyl-terminal hydrolase 23 isoform X2 n=1 Tax=Daucus carota subsp. sativus TaxID=79200 RepID=UPI0030826E0F
MAGQKIAVDAVSRSDSSRHINFHVQRRNDDKMRFNQGPRNFRMETLNSKSSNSERRSPKSKVDGSDGLEMDPDELNFRVTFRKIGAGLANLGNTCFLNSVLQCLTYTEPLAAYLQSGKHQTSCRTSGFCALCAIQKHVSRALQSPGRILAPKEIVSNLRCISRSFRNSRQEDAHEYMVNLLESMHKCCLPSGVPSESPSAYDRSLVHKIFGGRLRSQVKCMQCLSSSNKFDPFIDLSLEIVKADSLYKALAHFTAEEQLDGGAKQYQCQHCKQKVRAHKQLTIHKAPYVLTIHLKRFGSYLVGQKIDKRIHFGPTLDLKPFVTDPYDRDLKYTLYGVLVHAGWSTHSGHYYCFVRTSSGMWYSLDDNQVVQVSERKVLEQKAYMLFYYRDTRNPVFKKADQKDNMSANAMGRPMSSNLKQESKEAIQSAQTNTVLDSKATSLAQGDSSLNAALLLKNSQKDCSSKVFSSVTTEQHPMPKKDPLLGPHSNSPLLKDSLKTTSVTSQEDGDCMPQKNISCTGSLKIQNMMNSTDVIVKSGSDENCKEGTDSVTGKDSLKSDSVAGKDTLNSVSKLPDDTAQASPKKDLNAVIAISSNCCTLQTSRGITLGQENHGVVSELDPCVGSKEQTLLPPSSTIRENCQEMKDIQSAESSGLPNRTSVQKTVLTGRHVKQMKKLPKYPMMKMQLSSNIFMAASLRVRKKKHKRNKKCISETRHLSEKILVDANGIPLDLQPSTCNGSQPFYNMARSQRKVKKAQSKKNKKSDVNNLVLNSKVDSVTGVTDGEVVKGVGQNCDVLTYQSMKSCITGSEANEWNVRGDYNSKDSTKQSMQKGVVGMLTRGLEETIVARWGELDSQSQMIDTSSLNEFAIGYVADEWDKEYDQGRRKRIRSCKHDFSKRNPFQEIATMNAKVKRARMDQSDSGNRPFRI